MFTREQIDAFKLRLAPHGEEISDVLLAVVFLTVKELNILRDLHGLAPRTKTQVINAIRATAQDLEAEDD